MQIGANLGFYSVMAAKRGYDVIIVEPSKEQTSQILCSLYKNNIRVGKLLLPPKYPLFVAFQE